MNKNEFLSLSLPYDNYGWKALAKIANVDDKTVRTWCKQEGIIKKKQKTKGKNSIAPEGKIEKLTEEGYNSIQIAKLLGLTTRQVTCFKNHKKIHKSKFQKIILTPNQEQVVIGSILGDGCISRKNKKYDYYCLSIKHGIKQYDYTMYKYNILKNLCLPPITKLRIDNRPKFKDSIQVILETCSNPLFKEYRKKWYKPKKIICIEDLYKLKGLGIAIWYMDDGYLSGKHPTPNLSTNCFSIEDLKEIVKFFKIKFNINCTIQGNKIIHVRVESREKFISLIKPYIPKSMIYKVRLKSLELQENPEVDNLQLSSEKDIKVSEKVQRLTNEESTNKFDTSEGQFTNNELMT